MSESLEEIYGKLDELRASNRRALLDELDNRLKLFSGMFLVSLTHELREERGRFVRELAGAIDSTLGGLLLRWTRDCDRQREEAAVSRGLTIGAALDDVVSRLEDSMRRVASEVLNEQQRVQRAAMVSAIHALRPVVCTEPVQAQVFDEAAAAIQAMAPIRCNVGGGGPPCGPGAAPPSEPREHRAALVE